MKKRQAMTRKTFTFKEKKQKTRHFNNKEESVTRQEYFREQNNTSKSNNTTENNILQKMTFQKRDNKADILIQDFNHLKPCMFIFTPMVNSLTQHVCFGRWRTPRENALLHWVNMHTAHRKQGRQYRTPPCSPTELFTF